MASVHSSPSAFSTGFHFFTALLAWLLLQSSVIAQSRPDEVRSLLRFKDQIHDPDNGYWNTWRETDENPCAWVGVVCTANSTVSELDLSGWHWDVINDRPVFSLGVLSNLRDLRRLDLSHNGLGNVTVEGSANLTGLTMVNLSSTSLYTFPDFGNLTGLSVLDLSLNFISGEILPGISAWRNLRSLYLNSNYFLKGGIPNLRGLKKLQFLLLSENDFSGPFPQELGELTSLVTLDVSDNYFNGTIPTLPNLSNLVDLNLGNNYFTEFETDWFLGANFTLSSLSVSNNWIGGMIPSSLTKLLKLQALDLSGNRLSGAIPVGFSLLLSNPGSLDLSDNQLMGSIPADLLVSQTGCSSVNLSRNLLTSITLPLIEGTNDSCFSTLDFSDNSLSGPFPWTVIGNISGLWLQNNQLSGDIVDALSHNPGGIAAHLTLELYVQNNLFTGDLSRIANSSLDELRFPPVMDLSNNDLRWTTSDVIPDPIQATLERLSRSNRGLVTFRAGGNNFEGTSLPTTCFFYNSIDSGYLGGYLGVVDLSNSQLHGEIMSAAFNRSCLQYLSFLNLSNNNHITGHVPDSIVTSAVLEVLDISYNSLSGPIPTLPSNSHLSRNPGFFGGNDGLCGYPLDHACPSPGSGVQWWVLLVSIGGCMTIALIGCVAVTWRWRVYRRMHQQDADLIKTLLERDSASLMPLRELRKATHNFAEEGQIGHGGFGTVYMGKLNDGTAVAIKRSKREGSDKDKEQFLNEVRILSHVNHRNLVKLIGCCMENKIALLVFEFVSNGTLQEHLHGKNTGPLHLTWKQRLNIAVQTADALNYLHSAATFPIYHRDVKSANILLTDELSAKVADFGISRLAPLQATHVSTVAVQGTLGYIDPEYYTSYQLTDKSDVYSFGVVLLELISAKPALDFLRGGEDTSLVNFAGPYFERGNLEGFIDPALMGSYSTDSAGQGRESILSVGRLAMACVDMRSKARPSMNEVLKELHNLWLELQGTAPNVDPIMTDDDEDAQRDDIVLFSESFCAESSSFTVHSHASGIQLSQFSRPWSFK